MLRIEAFPHVGALHRKQYALRGGDECQEDYNSPPIHNFYTFQTHNNTRQQSRMSLQSDEQTLDRESAASIEELIEENRIKDLALSKASSLIELLSVELEAERNSRVEAVRRVEEELRYQFSKELEAMKEKVEFLERELRRCNSVGLGNVATTRQASLSRSESGVSVGRKRRSNNKKYTQINSEEGNIAAERQGKIKAAFVEEYLMDFAEWKEEVIENLNLVVANDYEELRELFGGIEARYMQVEDVFGQSTSSMVVELFEGIRRENGELKGIISDQQCLINEMKVQMQQLEDVYKHALHKLTAFSKMNEQRMSYIDLPNLVFSVKLCLGERKSKWEKRIALLQDENLQLKNILDSIINLVQDDRRLRY